MNKYAVVTGAERGLGLALTKQFLANNFYVFAGRFLKELKELDELKKEYPDQLEILSLDVSNDVSVKLAIKQIAKRTDTVDILLNNAAILGDIKATVFDELDFDAIQNVININGLGALRMSNALIPFIMNSEHKLIANISSEAGSIGQCTRVAWFGYNMGKAALNMHSVVIHNSIKD